MKNLTKNDFEKLILLGAFAIIIIAISIRYVIFGIIDSSANSIIGILLGGIIGRKGLSYFKPEQYYEYNNEFKKDPQTVTSGYLRTTPIPEFDTDLNITNIDTDTTEFDEFLKKEGDK